MPYSKQTWVDNNTTYPLSAARMNYIEGGIETAQAAGESAQTAANNAQTSANNAQTTANDAQTTANERATIGMVLALGG